MRHCDDCRDVAQWVMLWVTRFEYSAEEKRENALLAKRNMRPLSPRGPEFKPAGFFCTTHKEKLEKIPSEVERVFRFTGVTVGSHHT